MTSTAYVDIFMGTFSVDNLPARPLWPALPSYLLELEYRLDGVPALPDQMAPGVRLPAPADAAVR